MRSKPRLSAPLRPKPQIVPACRRIAAAVQRPLGAAPKVANTKAVLLVFWLSIALVLNTRRLLANDDDTLGYLHEFYREDDHRMTIDTDSIRFDLGLGEHVRLDGLFVNDAISGATPTGAPPQTQWPFPTFTDYYKTDYNQFFQAAINNTNNLNLYNAGYFSSYQAYTNYVATNNPQLVTQAKNSANASYQALLGNPNIHNTSVPLTQLTDHRRAFSLSAPITFGIQQFTPEASISEEHDYHSFGGALNYALALNEKNTTLNAGWSHNYDRVLDNVRIWEPKSTDDIVIGLNQLLTAKSYVTFAFTYGYESGYLSDPYRGVMFQQNFLQNDPNDAALVAENRPRHRDNEIFYTSFNQFVDPLAGNFAISYRFFHDSYGIFAHTGELDWFQKLGRQVILNPTFRYYHQSAASFYNVIFPDYDNKPDYYSSDYRLSRLETFNMGITLMWRIHKHLSFDLSYARYLMRGLDNITSSSAYPSANIYTVGARIWF